MMGSSALALSTGGCGVVARGTYKAISEIRNSELWYQGRHGKLTETELGWAKIAWKYFENNYQPETGLLNSVDKYPTTTLWHIGDLLAAMTIAREFEFITTKDFDDRISALLEFLNKMDLFFGKLPNKAYNTQTGAMVGYDNQPNEIGWSAIDIGRLLIWLKIIATRHPQFTEYIEKAVLRWNFCEIIGADGTLYGGSKVQNQIKMFGEMGPGYIDYCKMGFKVWGFVAVPKPEFDSRHRVRIEGIEIVYDSGGAREKGTNAPIVSGPFLLYGLEFNWDFLSEYKNLDSEHTNSDIADLAERIYRIQEARYKRKGILTARTDHQLGKAPFYLYDSIFAGGYPWNSISDNGDVYQDLALVSTRAAFGMWSLWRTGYTSRLMQAVEELYDKDRGWYEGRYEQTGAHEKTITSSTNCFVLEALAHKSFGKLYTPRDESTYRSIKLRDVFRHPGRCHPGISAVGGSSS